MTNKFGVDRARFLALAAALAGAASFQACSSTDKKAVQNAGGADMTAAGNGSTAGAKSDGGDSSEAGSAGEQATSGAAGAGAGGASDSAAGASGASEGGAAGAGECSDSVGVADCTGLTAACDPYCNAALANLKPAAADAAVACLKLDTTGNCDGGYACLAKATAKGCAEDVTAACAVAAKDCNPPDASDPSCEQLLSGMKPAARTEAASCMTEGCYSVYSCAEGLFFQGE